MITPLKVQSPPLSGTQYAMALFASGVFHFFSTSRTEYLTDRAGAFGGYAPEEAEMAANGLVRREGRTVGLFICPETERAGEAFAAVYRGEELPALITPLKVQSPPLSGTQYAVALSEVMCQLFSTSRHSGQAASSSSRYSRSWSSNNSSVARELPLLRSWCCSWRTRTPPPVWRRCWQSI